MSRQWLQIALGILTAIGGFVDVGAVTTAGEAGAQFGLGLIWAMVLGTLAIMLLVEMSGRFAAISKKTYAGAIRERFGFKFYLLPLSAALAANSMLLAAEMGGVSIAVSLFTGGPWRRYYPLVALLVWLMIWRGPFKLIENAPSLMGLVTFSFWVAIFLLGVPSPELVSTMWRPRVEPGQMAGYLYIAAAMLGAVISPYLVVFYSSGAREERWTRRSLVVNRASAVVGMGFGSLIGIALIILSALVLGPQGVGANTLAEVGLSMARAMGPLGSLLFATALFTTCLGAALEIVLAMSYNISQGFGWEWGEEKLPAEAPRFNLVLTLFLLLAFGIGWLNIDPIQLTLYASTFTALVLPVALFPFLVIMNDRRYLGQLTNRPWMNVALVGILLMAFVVAVVSIPLMVLSGG